ncbi:MAG: DJ-1/PfpI family protein [Hyphomicrobiaceae bacterium]|nr:DJ-1/PfpI family protein [Hyphomicrobiaceae bacterium]
MKQRNEPARFGIVVYAGVEPIDLGATAGVISMARRVLPAIDCVIIAAEPGVVELAGGVSIIATTGFDSCPVCDIYIVCGGPGWEQQVLDRVMLTFLRRLPQGSVASVCTGGLILAAAGVLCERQATTRRHPVGTEAAAPLARLVEICSSVRPIAAAVCDDRGVVTSGGVSLAIDGTLYLIGSLYGRAAQDEVARVIEYHRSFEANRTALGHAIAR